MALPDEQVRAMAEEPSLCAELQASFRRDRTTGDAERDREYLTRCLGCDELLTQIRFSRIADLALALAVGEERCGRTWPPLPGADP